ncbi:NVEALA domain-containing protein [Sphingobacterium sp. UT-1RO-CII-1]|uniref:NVEALA domain-containing protein n=1 Tax=Sphingobacterium sp. UT-1RO-CII-1 TaxID=2995225 RepID=UPI00227CD9E9|nr:NVEALA domain-containing protein [Sphingobacterium sp. UT-1RO-CII-1]MCY4778298.1 NVEALA domain-containing protein [Sphingobacterium sp. UT-1RO-CII-1]
MKKKILGAVAVIAIAAVATFNMNINNNDELSAISLANVEAIAQGETGGSSGTFTCYSTYNNCLFWDCSTIYRCGNPCQNASADSWSNQGTCSL